MSGNPHYATHIMAINNMILNLKITLAVFSIGLLLVGCSEPQINWGNYSPEVKQNIDTMAVSKDCRNLQKHLGAAELNSDYQKQKTGEDNALLMRYIDEQMRAAGCYT